MDKISVIQDLIDAVKGRIYLEIGVASGDCFLKIRADNKIAVDPEFTIPLRRKLKGCFDKRKKYYYRMPSDDFFRNAPCALLKKGVDVVFVDGLHTHEQTLRDIKNSLGFLKPGGAIVVHDCNPKSPASAYPAASYEEAKNARPEGWTGEWSGDVWKTMPYLRSTRGDLGIFVLDCDCGLGIITKGGDNPLLECEPGKIKHMDYGELEKRREYLLNLKPESYLSVFLQNIKRR